jgi:hypothetical protein
LQTGQPCRQCNKQPSGSRVPIAGSYRLSNLSRVSTRAQEARSLTSPSDNISPLDGGMSYDDDTCVKFPAGEAATDQYYGSDHRTVWSGPEN